MVLLGIFFALTFSASVSKAEGEEHYYTASKYEAQSLVKGDWKWDNGAKPVFYS